MTDPANSTLPTAANATAGVPAQSNPLDALEAILQEAKAKASAGEATNAPAPVPTGPDPAAAAALEAKKEADLATLLETNKVLDEASLKAELAKLSQVSNMSEEKARVKQENDEEQSLITQQQKRDEFVINQLGHTKI